MPVSVVWFKRDLRVTDHVPLVNASALGPVLPLYVVEPDYWMLPDSAPRHWGFVRDCLVDLRQALARLGQPLVVRQGEIISVLRALHEATGFTQLHSHEETGNAWTYARDIRVAEWCRETGVDWQEIPSHGVVRRLVSRDGWSKRRDQRMARPLVDRPVNLQPVADLDLGPIPDPDRFYGGAVLARPLQPGGRAAGRETLESFVARRSRDYLTTISKPGLAARHCSRLSPHIAFGSLSVREVVKAVESAEVRLRAAGGDDFWLRSLTAFQSRLAWRCHFVQKLEDWPEIEMYCMHQAFEMLRPRTSDPDRICAWAEGRTGYPLIDAAMRSLTANGWITFRMRAMLVSFASYHLWIDWRETAPILARAFTDYEPGIHFSQFQMQSGVTGMNTLRIYNPVKQSLDHDPTGRFIRRYVPELVRLPDMWIHEPWRAPESVLADAGVRLGIDYPRPIVEHDRAVAEARAAIAAIPRDENFRNEAMRTYSRLGSRHREPDRRRKPKAADKDQLSLF
jgi:deoxyribodipyrimidine photo-lyase